MPNYASAIRTPPLFWECSGAAAGTAKGRIGLVDLKGAGGSVAVVAKVPLRTAGWICPKQTANGFGMHWTLSGSAVDPRQRGDALVGLRP